MSTGRDEALAESAGRIADGRDEDWDEALGASDAAGAGSEGLRQVARIARAWRELGVRPADDGVPAEPVLFRWGGLEAREKLGEGSFGEVYRAWDASLDREVALKLRREGGDEAFLRAGLAEARRLARVRHPHVLVVHGADVHDGRAGLWTELVDGETLEASLAARGTLGAPEAAALGLDLCRALAAVHAAGLVHGDLKAGNVMRARGGRVVLMDFGSGRDLGTGGGAATGSPLSAAPEVLAGEPAGPAADQYSLGALLFRLVTGRHPVTAGSIAELREKQARNERESLRAARPDLPSAFVAAVERALERDPARRWRDSGAFERALQEALAPASAAPAAAAAPRGPRRLLLVAAAAAVLAVAALGLWPRLAGPPAGPVSPEGAPLANAAGGGAGAPAAGVVPAGPPAEGVTDGRRDFPAAAPPGAAARPGATAGALVVDATLWRARGGERTALASGGAIAPGDHLFLDYRGGEPLHVYVLDEDERGETFTLFPVAGTDLANPLAGGVSHRLPGRRGGEPFDWVVTSAGGREHVLVVVSRTPLAVLEDLVAATVPAASGREVRYAPVPGPALATLRGIGGLAPAPAGEGHEGRLGAIAAALASRGDGGTWVKHLVLQSR